MQLVYFDRVQFKGMRVNRTYPTIIGWTDELARKKIKEENKSGSFGKGTVILGISKPADVAAATSKQNDQAPVGAERALNVPSSSVDRVAGILQKLASTVEKFGEAMTEIGKQGAPVNVMRKIFSGLFNMLNVASTMEATSTPTSSQLDDIFFGSESFTTTVDALDTSLKEYLALGSFAIFWKVDELTEEVVDINWKESENYIDCGLFVMRHKETYNGTLQKWNSGFRKKASLNGRSDGVNAGCSASGDAIAVDEKREGRGVVTLLHHFARRERRRGEGTAAAPFCFAVTATREIHRYRPSTPRSHAHGRKGMDRGAAAQTTIDHCRRHDCREVFAESLSTPIELLYCVAGSRRVQLHGASPEREE
nr:uncharacterized protein LOC109158994 [Ipomoea trifida]